MNEFQPENRSRMWSRLAAPALILLLALPAMQPFFSGDLTCGFDTTFHLWRAVEADALLRTGTLLPRWAPHMAHGYGYPLFMFQGPLSAMLAALIHFLPGIDWPAALNLTYALGIILSGWTMWLLARDFWGERGAILAAVAYLYAPYHAYVALFRASLSETMAWALLPLLLWGLRRWQLTGQRRGLVTAALAFAALFYTHDVTVYAAFPLLLGWIALWGWSRHSWRVVGRGALAFVLGLGGGAFFWLPALAERGQIQFARAQSAWPFLYENNFLPLSQLLAWPHHADPLLLNDWPPRGIGAVLATTAVLGMLFAWRLRPKERQVTGFLVLAAVGTLFFTSALSQPIWDALALLSAFQFPWRFLAPATLLLALLAGGCGTWLPAAMGSSTARTASLALNILLLGALSALHWGWFYPDLCAPPAELSLAGMVAWEKDTDTLGTTASRELLPVTVARMPKDENELPVWTARLAEADLPAGVSVATAVDGPLRSEFNLNAAIPFTARYRAFAFPGWQVEINGEPVPIIPSKPEGLITFLVPAGQHRVTVAFGTTPLRQAAGVTSLLAGLALLGLLRWIPLRRIDGRERADSSADGRFGWMAVVLAIILILIKILVADGRVLPLWQTRLSAGALEGVDQPAALILGAAAEPEMVRLWGYDALPSTRLADDPLVVTLYWQAMVPLNDDFRVGLTLVDAAGRQWSLPGLRDWRWGKNPAPTMSWPLDQYARTSYFVDPLPGTPPGRYTLMLSLFEKTTLSPLTFFEEGRALGPAVPLGAITLTPPAERWAEVDLAPQYPFTAQLQTARLSGSNIDRNVAAPGDGVLVTLFWETEAKTAVPLTLAVETAAGESASTWSLELPAHGPGRWRLQTMVRLPIDLAAGNYQWQVRDGQESILRWGELRVVVPDRLMSAPPFAQAMGTTLSGQALLAGATVTGRAAPGAEMSVTLVWQGERVMDASYHRFLQLLGADGRPLAQADGVPAGRLTTGWLPGEYLVDVVPLLLPLELPPGEYPLITGLYLPGDGRLHTLAGADFIALEPLIVEDD